MEEDSTSTVAVVESRAAVSSSEDGPTSRLSHVSKHLFYHFYIINFTTH